jgi:hypothetical protein
MKAAQALSTPRAARPAAAARAPLASRGARCALALLPLFAALLGPQPARAAGAEPAAPARAVTTNYRVVQEFTLLGSGWTFTALGTAPDRVSVTLTYRSRAGAVLRATATGTRPTTSPLVGCPHGTTSYVRDALILQRATATTATWRLPCYERNVAMTATITGPLGAPTGVALRLHAPR